MWVANRRDDSRRSRDWGCADERGSSPPGRTCGQRIRLGPRTAGDHAWPPRPDLDLGDRRRRGLRRDRDRRRAVARARGPSRRHPDRAAPGLRQRGSTRRCRTLMRPRERRCSPEGCSRRRSECGTRPTSARRATRLSALTREAGTSATVPGALNTIADQLPIYSGLVESARANSRQGFPIGAAYLRAAVIAVDVTMLPAADRLYTSEAQRLNDDYRTGSSRLTLAHIHRRERRRADPASSGPVLRRAHQPADPQHRLARGDVRGGGRVGVGIVGLLNAQNALMSAHQNGSDSVEALSAATVLSVARTERPQPDARQSRHRHSRFERFQRRSRPCSGPISSARSRRLLGERHARRRQPFDRRLRVVPVAKPRTHQGLEQNGQLTDAIAHAPQCLGDLRPGQPRPATADRTLPRHGSSGPQPTPPQHLTGCRSRSR